MQATGKQLESCGTGAPGARAGLCLALAVLPLLFACAMLEEILPVREDPATRDEQAAKALVALDELRDLDAYIKLDNEYLAGQIRAELDSHAQAMEGVEFTRLRVRFRHQFIELEARLLATAGAGVETAAKLAGDVELAFSGGQLIWMPRFHTLEPTDSGYGEAGNGGAAWPEGAGQGLLERVNREVADTLIVMGKNVIGIDPLPMGHIEVGAQLSDFIDVSARDRQALGGVFTVAGAAILIEPGVTSIALDLAFIPSVSDCPADVRVSRSAFAREIRAREPVGVSRHVDQLGEVRHFFTEISGASRPTAVIHYWFADGRPVAVEELPVEPSFRWRTWSSKTIDRDAGNWEVIVVEKATGCILHSLALRADPAVDAVSDPERLPGQSTFEHYRSEFETRVAGFSILDDQPEMALVEVPRGFLSEVLHASVRDLRINVDFDVGDQASRRVSGVLRPFDASGIGCDARSCEAQRDCTAGFTQCARRRDARNCTTCLFRNPLNGRCMNEGVDPICEAARVRQNAFYAAELESCQDREAAQQADCELLRDQEIRSCEIEAASEQSACEAGREVVARWAGAAALATVSGQVRTTGGLRAVFSDFAVEGELEGLRMNLGFSAALDLDGTVGFSPGARLAPLSDCLSKWRGTYRSKIVMPLAASNMFGPMAVDGPALVTAWSGYVLSARISPAPLEALFVNQPRLLADCHIGLTVEQVSGAMSGADGAYFAGRIGFGIQPLPSRIELAPAMVEIGGRRHSAAPVVSDTHLRFDIGAQ